MPDTRTIKLKTYSKLRGILTPKEENSRVLFLQSLFVGIILFSTLYYLKGAVFSTLYIVYFVESVQLFIKLSDRKDTRTVITFNKNQTVSLVISTIVLLFGLIFIPPLYTLNYIKLSPLIVPIIFWFIIYQIFGKIVRRERRFYIDIDDITEHDWETASIMMEKGLAALEKEKYYKAYYYFDRADSSYSEIEEVYNPVLNTVAENHKKATKDYKEGIKEENIKKRIEFFKNADDILKESNKQLSYRICNKCGKKRKVENVYKILSGDRTAFYCKSCHTENEKESAERKTRQKEKKEKTKAQKKTVSEKDTRKSVKPAREYIEGNLTEEWCLDVLGITDKENTDIEDAFREQVKKHHPDQGGYEEDFKKVKEAREHLKD